jgi:hypothetical protein
LLESIRRCAAQRLEVPETHHRHQRERQQRQEEAERERAGKRRGRRLPSTSGNREAERDRDVALAFLLDPLVTALEQRPGSCGQTMRAEGRDMRPRFGPQD